MSSKILSALLALAVLTSGVGTVAGVTTVEQFSRIDETADANITLPDETITAERGGNATIPVTMENASTATVQVGGLDEVNWLLDVTVTDGNDDGRVRLTFDTDGVIETDPIPVSVEADGDSVTVNAEKTESSERASHPPLDVGTYDVRVFEGNTTEGEPAGETKLLIQQADTTTGNTTTDQSTESTSTTTQTDATQTNATQTNATTETTPRTDGESSGTVPGFGVGLSLVALAAAAMLAARRKSK